MDGLASQMAMPSVEEIMALLMQGIPPEKLLEQGVPQELIAQAVQMLQQQMAAQQQAPIDPASNGLAQGLVG